MTKLTGSSCSSNNPCDLGSNNVCGYMHVDLNGREGPNKAGYDVHTFVIKNDGLYPAGCDYRNEDGTITLCTNAHQGYACTSKAIEDGAINY